MEKPIIYDTRKFVWYQLYAFVVGRAYDQYGDPAGYHFSSYIVLPYGTRYKME